MPIACLRVPHFALRVALLERPELDGVPLVLSAPSAGRIIVADRTPEAAARGIQIGMAIREATALCPETVVLTPDPVREATLGERLLTALEALSPSVEADAAEPGCWYVDLRGLDRQLGLPPQAAQGLLTLAPPALRPRVGVAPGKFAARVAAGRAGPGTARVVDPAEVQSFLAGEAITWLPLPPETLRRLERLGLRTLGALRALPAAAVAARFGPAGRHAWELAGGRDDAPVRPRPREETIVETLDLDAPATSRETLLIGMTRLVLGAFGRPAMRSRHVRQARLRATLEGGRSWEKTATLREPAGAQKLVETLGYRLQAVELSGAVEALALELTGLTGAVAKQPSLPGLRRGSRRGPVPRSLVDATRQLKQRYGTSPLYRIVEVEPWSRIPERRHALISYDP